MDKGRDVTKVSALESYVFGVGCSRLNDVRYREGGEMQHFIRIKNQLVMLDDCLDERNWSEGTRKTASWLCVAGIGLVMFLMLWGAG